MKVACAVLSAILPVRIGTYFTKTISKLGCNIPADNQTDQSDLGGISRRKARENTARKSRLVLVFFLLVKEVARDFQPITNRSAADERCNREIIP